MPRWLIGQLSCVLLHPRQMKYIYSAMGTTKGRLERARLPESSLLLEDVVDAVRYSCVSPGGTVFAPTGVEVVVPVVAILTSDLDVDELDTTMRNHTAKWQLSSEDHSRILHLLSETLDSQVATAVRNDQCEWSLTKS